MLRFWRKWDGPAGKLEPSSDFLRVPELWLDTSSGSKWPKCSFHAPDPKPKAIFQNFMILPDSSYDFGENEVLFVKIGARVLDIWLDTSFGPKWPKFSFLAQDPKVMKFLKLHNFIGLILWFLRKWGPVCRNSS